MRYRRSLRSLLIRPNSTIKKISNNIRDLTADAAMLAGFDVDYVYPPERAEIYPDGFSTYVYVEGLTESLGGSVASGTFSRRRDCRNDSL